MGHTTDPGNAPSRNPCAKMARRKAGAYKLSIAIGWNCLPAWCPAILLRSSTQKVLQMREQLMWGARFLYCFSGMFL